MKKDKNDNIIDLGSINVPTSWNDVSLKKFSEIERYYNSISGDSKFNVIDVLHILIDKDKDWIMSLPMDFLEKILEKLMFLNEKPEEKEPSNKIEIDGDKYIVNTMEKLKFGEWATIDGILKSDKYNYAAILAVICRKEGEKFDSKYEAELFDIRLKMWEEAPVVKVMPIVNFFFQLSILLSTLSELSMAVEELLDQSAKNIETSQQIGVCKKYYLKWQMMKLRKSLKSNKYTSLMRSHSSHTLFKKGKQKKHKMNTKSK